MTSPEQAYGLAPYGGSTAVQAARAPGLAIPGYDPSYSWLVTGADEAYGRAAYGGRSDVGLPAAGLSAAPDPAAGVVVVPVFWAFAERATLNRVDVATGERTPVRSSPVALPPTSRRNSQSNPKTRDSLTGLAAGSNTSLSRLTGLTIPGYENLVTTAARLTATAAGAVAVTLSLDPAPLTDYALGFLVRSSALTSSLGLSIAWRDASSTLLGTTTHAAPAKSRTQAVGAWSWTPIPITDAPFGAASGLVSITAGGLAAGATVDVTARIAALGTADPGPYFDGDYPGAAWTGTPGLSYSDQGGIVHVVDAEAPLARPVRYELTSSGAAGFVAVTAPLTLDVDTADLAIGLRRGKRQTLLTHPGLATTFPVWIEDVTARTRVLERTAFKVKGRARKVFVSATERTADSGTLTFIAETPEELARLEAVFDDGSPVLLRTPPRIATPSYRWVSIGDLEIATLKRSGLSPVTKISGPYDEVDRPSVATRPLVA